MGRGDRGGYANLCRLLTAGKRRAEKGDCLLRVEDLLGSGRGLVAAVVWQRIDLEGEENAPHPGLSPAYRGEGRRVLLGR